MRRKRTGQPQCMARLVNKFSRIQNPMWIKRMLELLMYVARNIACRLRPPAFFREPDSVLACDHSAPRQHLRKKIIERLFQFVAHDRVTIISIRHDIDMNVSVTGMTKTGDRES